MKTYWIAELVKVISVWVSAATAVSVIVGFGVATYSCEPVGSIKLSLSLLFTEIPLVPLVPLAVVIGATLGIVQWKVYGADGPRVLRTAFSAAGLLAVSASLLFVIYMHFQLPGSCAI